MTGSGSLELADVDRTQAYQTPEWSPDHQACHAGCEPATNSHVNQFLERGTQLQLIVPGVFLCDGVLASSSEGFLLITGQEGQPLHTALVSGAGL